MKALEERAFAEGVKAEDLMEQAGCQIASAVQQFFPRPGHCIAYLGKGHNGGDALVAARYLALAGWKITLSPVFPEADWSPLTREKLVELGQVDPSGKNHDGATVAVLDGLLGIGAGGALREPIRKQASAINALRARSNARVFALDIPTGLDGDLGTADPETVVADFTLTIGFAKTGLLADGAARFVGRLAVLPLPELSTRLGLNTAVHIAGPAELAPLLPRRHFDKHKGDCGRVGIIAGAPGTVGAAILCAEAALHAGAGLVTLYVPPGVQAGIVARIAPEVMVRAVTSCAEALAARHDVFAIGPGFGRDRDADALEVIGKAPQPVVIDADALNALSTSMEVLQNAAGPRLLTPHPGEMQRLDANSAARSRREIVESFTERFPATLLLKGSRTLIGERGRPLSYNTTGSPGMATGGMGDVLAGVCGALSGQGLSPYDSARVGAWLCGRAAEIAIAHGESEESLSATHIVSYLGRAFHALRAPGF